jgi:hypothetical protein
VQNDVANVFPPQGWLEDLNAPGIGLKAEFLFSSSSNLQNKVFALCPQFHHVVVKHKVSY